MLKDWFILFVWISISLLLSVVLFSLGYSLVKQPIDFEKLSSYECGFNPFEETYGRFDVKFYLVAILFIIFDLEVSFLFPWSIVIGYLGFTGMFAMFYFLLILSIGFFYEWKRGALNW